MKLSFIVILLLSFTGTEKIKVWKENGGVAVIEAEHIQTRNDLPLYWSRAHTIEDYSGTGYLYWTGSSFPKEDYTALDEERILEYHAAIRREGVYYVKIKGLCVDEYEASVLIRINGSDWHTYTIRNEKTFSWDINIQAALCAAFLPLGYHKIEIAAVSAGFMVDKLQMVHESEMEEDVIEKLERNNEARSEYIKLSRFRGVTN